jgi:hypothetical protein
MSFELPSNDPLVDDKGMAFRTWAQWISWVHLTVTAARQSGTTAERPTSILWIGRQYFDRTLNKPVYVSAVKPTVWRDAAGTIV